MGRKLLQLSTLLILFFVKTTMAQDIPDAFRYQWEKAGLSQRKFSTTRTVNVKQVEASASEEISANELFEQALNELGGKSGTILFPQGTYIFTKPIVLRDSIILKGEGESTKFLFDFETEQSAIIIKGTSQEINATLQAPIRRNQELVQLNSEASFDNSSLIKITKSGANLVNDSWGKFTIGQIFSPVHVQDKQVYTDAWTRLSLNNEDTLRFTKISPISQVGLECLSISIANKTENQTSSIKIENARDVWVENVISTNANFAHIEVKSSKSVSIKGNYLHAAHNYGNGGKGYGVVMHFTTGETRVENNIFDSLRHSVLLQAGANGNVVGYNYSTNPYWTDVKLPESSAGDLVLHGNYPFANLFENNSVQNVAVDESHGKNGPHNCFYRNTISGYGVVTGLIEPTDSIAFVGNKITNNAFLKGNFIVGGQGHYENNNDVKGKITPENSTSINEISLYTPEGDYIVYTNGTSKKKESLAAQERFSQKEFTQCEAFVTVSVSKAATDNQFKAYPNPSKGQIQFNLPLQDLKVWNAQGQQVIHEDGSTSQNITIQEKGMFWIMGKAPDGQNIVSQVIVE